MRNVVFLIVLFAVVVSCRKEIRNREYPDFEPRPVLNALLSKGEPVCVHVSIAQTPDSVKPALCTNAEAFLYVDGTFAERLVYDPETDFYMGNTIATTGSIYSCVVVVPGYDTVRAQTIVPEPTALLGIEVLPNAAVGSEGSAQVLLLTLKNNPSKRMFFNMSINMQMTAFSHESGSYSSSSAYFDESYKADDPVLLNEGGDLLLFSNELMTDTTYTLKVNADLQIYSVSGNDLQYSGYVVPHINSLSEEYYRFARTYNSYQVIDGYSEIFIGTIVPTSLYSNVENGYGLFAGIQHVECDTFFIQPTNMKTTGIK